MTLEQYEKAKACVERKEMAVELLEYLEKYPNNEYLLTNLEITFNKRVKDNPDCYCLDEAGGIASFTVSSLGTELAEAIRKALKTYIVDVESELAKI